MHTAHPVKHTIIHRRIRAASVVLAMAGVVAAAFAWTPLAALAVALTLVTTLGVAATVNAGEALAAQWHWSTESWHRIATGRPEWFDLHAYLHRPTWRLRATAEQRAIIVYSARAYAEGGRGTNTPVVLLRWLRTGHSVTDLVHALETGADDKTLTRMLDGASARPRRRLAQGRSGF